MSPKISQFLIALLWWTLIPLTGWATGGELGNGYRAYNNRLGKYSLLYPAAWSYYDLNKSVSFVEENKSPKEGRGSLAIIDKIFPELTTKEQLLEQIKFFHPNEQWTPILIANHDGFQTEIDGTGIIYLLKGSENVLSIRYNAAVKQETLRKIEHMLSSLRIH